MLSPCLVQQRNFDAKIIIVLRVHRVGASQLMETTINEVQDDVVDFLDVHIHSREDCTTSTLIWITSTSTETTVGIKDSREVTYVTLARGIKASLSLPSPEDVDGTVPLPTARRNSPERRRGTVTTDARPEKKHTQRQLPFVLLQQRMRSAGSIQSTERSCHRMVHRSS
ncbi:hypothetical protein J6590_002171 [Homalodisca vitripennis]|nr:hypothetical protein J6590_002171 [Homalodisca vitripennis]